MKKLQLRGSDVVVMGVQGPPAFGFGFAEVSGSED